MLIAPSGVKVVVVIVPGVDVVLMLAMDESGCLDLNQKMEEWEADG